MKNIIITGAGGLVGLNLLTQLKEQHQHIIAIDKNSQRIQLIKRIFPMVQAECIDLSCEASQWEHWFVDVETIIQLHAQIQDLEPQPYWDNNVHAVENVVAVAKKQECKHLIHLSSSVVVSVSNDLYVQSKTAGEKIVLESGLAHTTLRPPLMYGCFDYKHLGFLTMLMEKLPLLPFPGHGKYVRQPLYVMDMCAVIMSAMKKGPSNQVYDLIGKEQIYFIDLLKIIRKKRKIQCLLLPLPLGLFAALVKLWGIIFGKAPFVKDQILALTAGDFFELSDWETVFDVRYTPFDEAINQVLVSEYKNYRSGHEE